MLASGLAIALVPTRMDRRSNANPRYAHSFCIAHYKPTSRGTFKVHPTAEAYGELQQAYDFYNDELFAGQLPACLITFQREKRTMGYFSKARFVRRDTKAQTDEIAINPEFFAVIPLVEILQTLCHEMVHLWQAHFGDPGRTCYHNKEWAGKMESIGLMPSDTGQPGGKKTGQSMNDYVIVGGLFEKATHELLRGGFAISWLDRFPSRPPSPISLPTARPPAALSWLEHTGTPEDDEEPEDKSSDVLAAYTAPAAHAPEMLVELQTRGNKSNRSKYQCEDCHAVSVWGKPKLRIKCADCDCLLTETP